MLRLVLTCDFSDVEFQLIKAFYAEVLNETSDQPVTASSSSEITILWSLTTALFIPGGLIGSLLGGWMADRFGRYDPCFI